MKQYIINPPDQGNPIKPEWIYMDEPRYYYDNNYDFLDVQLMVKDQVEHYLDIDLDEYNAICFVYAGDGNNYSGGTALSMGNDKIFTVSEKHINTFLHIGLPAHVFCNVLGAMPQFFGTYDPSFYSLMSYGYTNGTEEIVGQTITKKGSCPAAFDPPYRIFFDWVDPIEVEVPVYNLEIQFNYSSPKFYKVNILNSDEYFLLERRDPSGFHKFTPWEVNGYNDTPGILIWHVAPSAQYRFEIVELQYANNIPPDDVVDEKYLGHKFPYPNDEEQIFNDVSVPDANKRNGEFSFLNFRTWNQMVGNSPPKPFVDITLDAIEVTNTVTWSENMYLSSPVFIKNGGILNIIQGADITIVGDYIDQVKIVIEDGGTLNLTGLENNKVILQTDIYENPIIEWKGIEIYGSGTLVSNYAMIKNAIKPIYTDPTSNPSCSFYNTKIIDNTSELRGNITIDNSIFIRAPLKIYYSNSNSSITKSVFSLNDENEIAVYLVNPETSYLKVLNCTFNDLDVGLQFSYDPVSQWDRTNQLIVRNNIFSNSNHSIEIYDGSISISFNDFFNNNYNNYPGNNYLEVNPLYVNPGNSNFNLQWGSGCIDAGHTSPVYNDPDGTRNDMGAKFYDQSPVTPTNFTVTPLMDLHPLLQWEGAPHLDYIVYAHYDYLNGTSTDNEYLVLTESYVDETVVFANPPYNNQTVTYSVTSVNSIGDESSHSDEIQIDAYGRLGKIFLGDSSFIPTVYNLFNPYPNPFNPTTTIVFDLPEKSFVSIKLYSITGEEIRTLVNEEMRAGRHPFLISGNDLSSGVYLLRMVSNKYVSAKKLILMK